jgi:hypothetical protein
MNSNSGSNKFQWSELEGPDLKWYEPEPQIPRDQAQK